MLICFNLLQRVVAMAGCKWTLRFDNWLALKAADKGANLVAIVQPGEKDGAPFAAYKKTFTLASFVQAVAQPEIEKSLTGLRC